MIKMGFMRSLRIVGKWGVLENGKLVEITTGKNNRIIGRNMNFKKKLHLKREQPL